MMIGVIELAYALALVFGALTVWPLMRLWGKSTRMQLRRLKWQFWLHAIGILMSFLIVHFYASSGNTDWMHSLILPCLVGGISWIAALIILLSNRIAGSNHGEDRT